MTSSHAVYPVRKKPPSKKNFKENVPTYFRYTGGEFKMIQMDANTRELGKKKTETWDIVYIIVRRFYITLLRVRFLFF